MMRASGTFFERMEQMEKQCMAQKEDIDDKNIEIQKLKNKIVYLEEDNVKYLKMIEQVDEQRDYNEFENYKKKVEQQFKEKLVEDKKDLTSKMGELEHVIIKKNIEISDFKKLNKEFEKELESKSFIIKNYEQNYSENSIITAKENEIIELKEKINKFEQDVTFTNLKVRELESRVESLKNKHSKEIDEIKKKNELKNKQNKDSWKIKKEKFKAEIENLKKWKLSNPSEKSADPQLMY